ncbi:MAG: sugar ABC transporter permease [Acholeplasmatales bacterium]|jgi:multiple sugar transport system permease protein|nr:sugar ABC transporter permease [Acholeplasmataceae bacterium]MCK9234089.1 sugar ABC transporter permease [Acholeplasmataceae bacterium]MCK9289735.1 sugar ABC transporter permease [Acholeplasmataceae bacterium]MCK9427444.1 sugar ABC transporter permease [Acholeplasmataceae bacterium]MDY0115172.1 sugar ABC transporter permease [Acholeplasmatales bacterium]
MLERKKDYKAWLYLGIPLFLLSVFTFYPLIKTIFISVFTQYDAVENAMGSMFNLDAYRTIFRDKNFIRSIGNTLLLVFISVPISTVLALLIAVALNSIKPLQRIFQTIFFIPYVTNVLAIGMVFNVMFSHPFTIGLVPEGLINTLFNTSIDWIGVTALRKHWMLVVMIYVIWNALPFKILVFIGGLQNISKQYYDAAKIDAATPKKTLLRITVPLLSPLISYILITSFIGAFKSYESVLSVVGGVGRELDRKRWTAVAYVYDKIGIPGLDGNNVSYYSRGAAAAVILFLIIMVFTFINLYASKKRVHY